MSGRVLKAVAAALAAAGALAGAGNDDVSLVQKDVRSIDLTDVDVQAASGVLIGMFGAMRIESVVRGALGEDVVDPDAMCSATDRDMIFQKLVSIGRTQTENGPMAVMQSVFGDLQDCQKMLLTGAAGPVEAVGACFEGILGPISPMCQQCTRGFYASMANLLSGCGRDCLPVVVQCRKASPSGPTEKCMQASTRCMKCTQPHFGEYAKCAGGSPNSDETLKAGGHGAKRV